METNELVQRILEERARRAANDRSLQSTYYMMNLRHPAVAVLYDEWKQENGEQYAPGDAERTAFELELMSQKARKLLERHYENIDRLKAALKGEGCFD